MRPRSRRVRGRGPPQSEPRPRMRRAAGLASAMRPSGSTKTIPSSRASTTRSRPTKATSRNAYRKRATPRQSPATSIAKGEVSSPLGPQLEQIGEGGGAGKEEAREHEPRLRLSPRSSPFQGETKHEGNGEAEDGRIGDVDPKPGSTGEQEEGEAVDGEGGGRSIDGT